MSLRFLTAGESHGKALVAIIEGLPSGIEISLESIKHELMRRKQGYGRGERQKIETEDFEILSGVRFGKTLGSPISVLIPNQDWANWQQTMSVTATDVQDRDVQDRKVEVPRPGHADYVGAIKYQHQDMRNVLERSSARETTIRVALGAIAKTFLKNLEVEIKSEVVEMGGVSEKSQWPQLVDQARAEGNTLGGVFELRVESLALGLGSYSQWDRRIEGEISKAIMSLNAIKGVEIGLGFESARRKGSDVHDEIEFNSDQTGVQYKTNNSGGITGGMTTGAPLVVRAAMKPLSTLKRPLSSISTKTKTQTSAHYERSDVCAVESAAVIGESLLALVLANSYLEKFGGDSISEIKERVETWKKAEKIFF